MQIKKNISPEGDMPQPGQKHVYHTPSSVSVQIHVIWKWERQQPEATLCPKRSIPHIFLS